MKFNKSFLFASIIAGSIALTACNDKEEKVAEKPVATETTQTAQQAVQQPQVKTDDLVTQANAEFLKVANVKVTNVSVTDDFKIIFYHFMKLQT